MPHSPKTYDFAVIGAGIAGASVAYELSKRGASVIVIEAEAHAAYNTTGRSAAFYSTAYGNDTVRQITLASREFYRNPPSGFCEHSILKDFGALYIAKPDQIGNLEKLHDEVKPRVSSVELVDRDFVLNKVPQLKREYVHAGFWEPESKEIDVASLLHGYIKLAKAQGCNFVFNARVAELEPVGQNKTTNDLSRWIIHLPDEHIHVEKIINAAGAWADVVGKLAGAKPIGLVPKKRNICIAKSPKGLQVNDWPLVLDVDDSFYFKPDGGNILITPADEIPVEPMDAFPDEEAVATGIDRFQSAMDVGISHLVRSWAGLRSFVADRSPVVGPDPTIKNFYWAAGQGGYGIQMAPALARLGASLATNNGIPSDMAELGLSLVDISPERCY